MKLSMESFSFEELHSLDYLAALRHEFSLVKRKIIARPKLYFFRDKRPIQLLDACSGEISFVSAMAFIATEIEENCCIMVDEPENSLHPTWQKSYIETVLDLFHPYQPRTVIATHSPIIVSGGEVSDERTRVFEMQESRAKEHPRPNLNLEEMYERLFDLITPKSRHLSDRVVDLLNQLNSGSISLAETLREIKNLEGMSYDEKQREILSSVEEVAVEINQKKGK